MANAASAPDGQHLEMAQWGKQIDAAALKPIAPADKAQVDKCFQDCLKGLKEASTAEKILLSTTNADQGVANIHNAKVNLEGAIKSANQQLQTLTHPGVDLRRHPDLQAAVHTLSMSITEMEARQKHLERLLGSDNGKQLNDLIQTKTEINRLLGLAKSKPEQAGEYLCQAHEELNGLRQKLKDDFPLKAEVDNLQARMDARARRLQLTEEQQKACSQNPLVDNVKSGQLATQALFIMIAKQRAYLGASEVEKPQNLPTQDQIHTLYKNLTELTSRPNTEQQFWFTPQQRGIYAQFVLDVTAEAQPKSPTAVPPQSRDNALLVHPQIAKEKVSSTAQQGHTTSLSFVKLMRGKQDPAYGIAKQLNTIALGALQIQQFMDKEMRQLAQPQQTSQPVTAEFSKAFLSIGQKIEGFHSEVSRLEQGLVEAELSHKKGTQELVGKLREQIADLKVQLKALEAKRAAMAANFPPDMQAIIQNRTQIARLTEPSRFKSSTNRLQDLSEAAEFFKQMDEHSNNLAGSPGLKSVVAQERAAAATMIQQAYAREYTKVEGAKREDEQIAKRLEAPKPKLANHPDQLVGYVSRGLMQLAIPDELKPSTIQHSEQRVVLMQQMARVRALLGEAGWNKLMLDPAISPFKQAYDEQSDAFPHAHALEQARQGLRNLATESRGTPENLADLYAVHEHIRTLQRCSDEDPTLKLDEQIATLRIELDTQSSRLLHVGPEYGLQITNWQKALMAARPIVVSQAAWPEFELHLAKLLSNAIFGVHDRMNMPNERLKALLAVLDQNPGLKDRIHKNPQLMTLLNAHAEISQARAAQAEASVGPNQPLAELFKVQRMRLIHLQQLHQLFSHPGFQAIDPKATPLLQQYAAYLEIALQFEKKIQAEIDALLASSKTAREMAEALENSTLNSKYFKELLVNMAESSNQVDSLLQDKKFIDHVKAWRTGLDEEQGADIRALFDGQDITWDHCRIAAEVAQRTSRVMLLLKEVAKALPDEPAAHRLVETFELQTTATNERLRGIERRNYTNAVIDNWGTKNIALSQELHEKLASAKTPEELAPVFDKAEFFLRDEKRTDALEALIKLRALRRIPTEPSVGRALRELLPWLNPITDGRLISIIKYAIDKNSQDKELDVKVKERILNGLQSKFKASRRPAERNHLTFLRGAWNIPATPQK